MMEAIPIEITPEPELTEVQKLAQDILVFFETHEWTQGIYHEILNDIDAYCVLGALKKMDTNDEGIYSIQNKFFCITDAMIAEYNDSHSFKEIMQVLQRIADGE